ncbi:DgyrCDS4843 [Dimorphilus gyrociliatus]|uniref:Glycogen debranching enzyme n=1 Tax=Dimorphilus gyrociliatus TaxID=2664684 RepID=A0A7I8VKE1_9ANNE|nr:DgyrCDS4843 [Dimorphilus gyrociliatus]
MTISGSFNYYFTVDSKQDGSGYFLVDPILKVGEFDERLPLDSITCQTYLSKNLGKFSDWEKRLKVAKECSYNMVHFTPVQSLGASNSAYCLRNQLEFNPEFGKVSVQEMKKFIEKMKNEWQCLSLVDLVLNHTANESEWLQDHPECAYNVVNSPHLRPAYLLDRILWKFGLEVGQGLWEMRQIPKVPTAYQHIQIIERVIRDEIFPKYKLEEFYLMNIENVVSEFEKAAREQRQSTEGEIRLVFDKEYRRLRASIDISKALNAYNPFRYNGEDFQDKLKKASNDLSNKLQSLNAEMRNTIQDHLNAAVRNFLANINWRFLDPNGPKCKQVDEDNPLMWNYFRLNKEDMTIEEEEKMMFTSKGQFCMAHNGWVMGDDPLRNFAESGSNVYLRRELIPWGDSVKLRYGSKPSDCPFLWQHMKNYAVLMASIFHGVRLDNCHSTPIHVAEYILDEARKVRPDLYVIAELFTSNEWTDNIFINRLGLTSLIREALQASDAQAEGGLVHRFGGEPVGAFIQLPARPLVPTTAHAILMDQTHDNNSPIEKRTVWDVLPNAALVSMASCASGSNRGYDELVPHHINVVTEKRIYQSLGDKTTIGKIGPKDGILAAKKILNKVHQMLGSNGFNQIYVDQRDANVVSVTRHNSTSHESIILVAYTAFKQPPHDYPKAPSMEISGKIQQILYEGRLDKIEGAKSYKKDENFINGLEEYKCFIQEGISPKNSSMVEINSLSDKELVNFTKFPPGSVIAFKVSLNAEPKTAIFQLRQFLSQFGYRMHTYSGRNLAEMSNTELERIVTKMTLNDLSRTLYRCDGEERDDCPESGGYNIPGWGVLPYCGLQGILSILNEIRPKNDLGHPLCNNIREGNWLLEYSCSRLIRHEETKPFGLWLKRIFEFIEKVPRYLVPSYFDAIITGIVMLVEEVTWCKMGEFVRKGSSFVRLLSMGSLQFISFIKSAPLPTLSPHCDTPRPQTINHGGVKIQACPSLAAGLPHFSVGIWRNWGRDTFIALRGLCLMTGREDIARFHILSYAGTVRHGLIPNLLGGGIGARYNARDAVWFWLQCIQEYCNNVPNGKQLLKDRVSRIFPNDDSSAQEAGHCEMTLEDVIQECLTKHAKGMKFRERNAGASLDNDMSDAGFIVEFGVNFKTGFVYGGNDSNCGTWMDKNGSAPSNKGRPATPRDGSAVELVGLQRSVISWLAKMNENSIYPYDGVVTPAKKKITFKEWTKLIDDNFEKYFFIPENEIELRNSDTINPRLVNRRNIYKDTVGATRDWADYQLRPNFCVAMVLAPEMFTPENAWKALVQVESVLMGPLGIKTLDPQDWNYNGDYVNSDETRGYNYHNGPEWLWPVGYFLRAKLLFAKKIKNKRPEIVSETVAYIRSVLSNHFNSLQKSDWKSLPELTNHNGSVCYDSCMAQAWSVGCILEVLYDLESISE